MDGDYARFRDFLPSNNTLSKPAPAPFTPPDPMAQ
jgi:hypothetical protein